MQSLDKVEDIFLTTLSPVDSAALLSRTIDALQRLCAACGRRLPPLVLSAAASPARRPQTIRPAPAPSADLIAAALAQSPAPPPLQGRRLTLIAPASPHARAELLTALAAAAPSALTPYLSGLPLSALTAAAERAEASWPAAPPPAPPTPLSALRRAAARAWAQDQSQPTHLKQLFAAGDDPIRRTGDLAAALADLPAPRRNPLLETLSPTLDAATLWAALQRDALQTALPAEAALRLWAINQTRPLATEAAALLATATPADLAAALAPDVPQPPAQAILNLLALTAAILPPSPAT